ncbi:MAG: ABC transporter permease [Chloroflexales bacterium]|nr:ABC transporter permease [Chloroflexales bacterium]
MMSTTATSVKDERLAEIGLVTQLLRRPELGAITGAIVVWLFFAIVAPEAWFSLRGTATYLEVAASLGIVAIPVALLMIGGEFDLSVGSMVGLSGAIMAILATVLGVPLWLGALIALAAALFIGWLNGVMVVKTGLPSFIITLGSLFIIRGLTIGLTLLITNRTQLGGLDDMPGYELMRILFAIDIPIGDARFAISIFWWLLIGVVASWILLRTSVGNWIFGAGGAAHSARQVGVPVNRLKIGLFMTTATAAWLLAMIQVTTVKSMDTLRGEQLEFQAIIAAVVGGTLLTGGYGSAIGAMVGALIIGMVRQGVVFAGVSADWFQVFMGAMLIIAVLINNYIRKRAEAARR